MSTRARYFTIALSVVMVLLEATSRRIEAQAGPTPPGVPEPGLVIWGAVVNKTNLSQAITITSASWSVTDGAKTAVYSAASRPATRIVNAGGQSYYILEVPFDTRRIGTITLADPVTVGIDSFELKSASPPTYTLTPTINGALASVQSIDGAPASGANVPVPGFSAATRGRVIRVDLAVIPAGEDYASWAAGIFGNANLPQAARGADPDGDGLTNEGEFAAGTDPKDPNSSLRILTLSLDPQQGRATVGWQSVSTRRYFIQVATDPVGPWTEVGTQVPGAGGTTQASVTEPPGQVRRFYRVKLAP